MVAKLAIACDYLMQRIAAMASSLSITEIQRHVSNRLDGNIAPGQAVAGIIGDSPSRYSKSPALWQAVFDHLKINARYLPFDVDNLQIGELIQLLRDSEQFIGLNVTVPHKVRVMDLLDDLDPGAARIQAVNTVVRSANGKLIGYNTDGEGFIDSLLRPTADHRRGFMDSLSGVDVLLLGAGGSARAVAFHVSDQIVGGRLIISNRTIQHAESLAGELIKLGRQVMAIDEEDVSNWAPRVGLIINSTTKGQGGRRSLGNGQATILAPYSALAPAHPPVLGEELGRNFEAKWHEAAASDIDANNARSMDLAKSIPATTRFYDLIYHPEETVFLQHGRATGHPTMNGKNMIVCQAVIALCRRICLPQVLALGNGIRTIEDQVAKIMHASW
jgi:shikimate dehydrogenase